MYLKACINGARTTSEHRALPVGAAQIATEVATMAAWGVDAVHLHVKDPSGRDTLDADVTAEVLRMSREVTPAMPLGVTTGAWIDTDPDERVAAVKRWTVLPDFASVNWHEEGAETVADVLLERGVAVEAGIWNVTAARKWLSSPLRSQCARILLELEDGANSASDAKRQADELLALIQPGMSSEIRIVLHGADANCWTTLSYARQLGLATRIGLEDTLLLPDGSPAADNAALVAAARGYEAQS